MSMHIVMFSAVLNTDRPKSVRNRCLIELFVALFVLSLCPFDISVGVEAFVIGLGQWVRSPPFCHNHCFPKLKNLFYVKEVSWTVN